MTVVRGHTAAGSDLPALLIQLKSRRGTGGVLQGDSLEIQGEHVERIRALLTELGYVLKG